jgi:hypothetical protein
MQHRAILTAILMLILACSNSSAQVITDTATLRNAINTLIVTNGAQQITAGKLNRILNGTLNVMPFATPNVDTIYQRGDSLFYKKNATEYFAAVTTGGGTYEPLITAPNSADYYYNGYKQFARLNYDSIADGSTYYGWTTTNITPGFGLIGLGSTPGKYLQLWADSTALATVTNARRVADSAAGAVLPSQSGNAGKFLTTNGSGVGWGSVSTQTHTIRGVIYNKNFWTTLTPDLTVNGATASLSSNKISISASTAGVQNETLDINDTTALENWRMFLRFTTNTAQSSTSYGLGIGIRSINSSVNGSLYAYVDLSSASHYLYIINTYPSIAIVGQSTTTLAYTNGDSLEYTLERIGNQFLVTARDATTNSSIVYASGTIPTFYQSSAPELPNTGKFAVYALGGSYLIDSLNVTSKELLNPDIVCVGDSKTVGYFSNYSTRWATLLKGNYINTVVLAGGGDKSADVINRLSEIIGLNPKQVLLEIGTNDPDSITTKNNIQSIVTSLQAAGITVYHLCFYQSSPNNAWRFNWLNNTYPGYVINTYTPTSVNGALAIGNLHPNNYGDSAIYNAIMSANVLTGVTAAVPNLFGGVTPNTSNYVPYSLNNSFSNSQIYQDANNNIAIGHTSPYNYGTGFQNLDVRGINTGLITLGQTGYTSMVYINGNGAAEGDLAANVGGTFKNSLTWFGNTGHVVLMNGSSSTVTDNGYTLDVFGTANFRNAVTQNTSLTNNYFQIQSSSTSANAASGIENLNSGGNFCLFFKAAASYGTSSFIKSGDAGFYNDTQGNITIQNANTTGNLNIAVGGSSSAQLTVAPSGQVVVATLSGGGAVYSYNDTLTNTNPSDRRLKHRITPVSYGLKEILKLKPVSFYYNSDSANRQKQFGFIAQEVKKVMPDAVRPLSEGSQYLGLEKDAIYVTLVNAIKELQAEIDILKKEK